MRQLSDGMLIIRGEKILSRKDLEVVIRKENSFYKFVVGDSNAKVGIPEEEERSGDLDQDSGIRMNTGGGHGSHAAVLLIRRSTTFLPTEDGAYWTSQWYHPSGFRSPPPPSKIANQPKVGEGDLSPC
ncbi:unnamed protein product [Strongylus vulgaris]|uniref:Uncharacterized protein n=1 Tax=Strongylus vulgaris TaxID=40348 RepID=A0A3P7L8G9_STRVU|nr:unnamed protein product [Strongylus vulgaris]